MTSETAAPHLRLAIISETGASPFSSAISIGDHHLMADEPVALGGLNAGPDPFEFLLAGLGACTAMTLRLYATRKGWPLDHVEVQIRHAERVTSGAPKDIFAREIRLTGALTDDQRAKLLEIADHCPVSRTLSTGVVIESALAEAAG